MNRNHLKGQQKICSIEKKKTMLFPDGFNGPFTSELLAIIERDVKVFVFYFWVFKMVIMGVAFDSHE